MLMGRSGRVHAVSIFAKSMILEVLVDSVQRIGTREQWLLGQGVWFSSKTLCLQT